MGYTIEEQDSALQFDEEYLLQMYINFITNYTVFKSLLESDQRNVTELAKEKREPVKPKFVKEIKEQIVEDRNIPDVEIRQVFVEEVTQAQLDAEAKLEEETNRREELERSLSELEFQMDSLNQQMEFLEQTRMQMEQERAELEEQLHNEQKVRQETEAAMAAVDIEAKNSIEIAQAEAKRSVENLQTRPDTVRKEKERELTAALDRAEKAEKDAKNSRKEKEKKQKAASEEIDRIRKEAADAAARSKKESRAAVAAAQREAAKAIEEARRKQEEAEAAMQKALQKAESASLSHYIVKRLQERRDRKNTDEDDSNS